MPNFSVAGKGACIQFKNFPFMPTASKHFGTIGQHNSVLRWKQNACICNTSCYHKFEITLARHSPALIQNCVRITADINRLFVKALFLF